MNANRAAAPRFPFIDAIKAIASQLIVLHHLAFYGPMSDYAQSLCPELISWLSQYARIAVQAFLVAGGFLAAHALARDGRLVAKPIGRLLWRRYLKLVIPYLVALLLAILAAAAARNLIVHESIPESPTAAQLVAHVFLLQSVLGFDGLSAGVWYVAIDFQLYAVLLLILWVAHRLIPDNPAIARGSVIALLAASLLVFNRDAALDNWAIYFFGAYGLGVITYWDTQKGRIGPWMAAAIAIAIAALWLDYRSRILVALLVASGIGMARCTGFIECWPRSKVITWLAQISYSVFLTHFPVCLVINAIFERFAPHSPSVQLGGMIVAWMASIASGALLHHWVELPAQSFRRKPKSSEAENRP